MDPVIYMALMSVVGGALALGVSWAFDRYYRR